MSSLPTEADIRLARLYAKLFDQIGNGTITPRELERFLELKNPFEFARNKHGHYLVRITGFGFSGVEEIARMHTFGISEVPDAFDRLRSRGGRGFNRAHQLPSGKYTLVLVPAPELCEHMRRTMAPLGRIVRKVYGYRVPLAGVAPRLRETLSVEQLQNLGIKTVYVPHAPIKKHIFCIYADTFDTVLATYDGLWQEDAAFAFLA